jgi:galactokinase
MSEEQTLLQRTPLDTALAADAMYKERKEAIRQARAQFDRDYNAYLNTIRQTLYAILSEVAAEQGWEPVIITQELAGSFHVSRSGSPVYLVNRLYVQHVVTSANSGVSSYIHAASGPTPPMPFTRPFLRSVPFPWRKCTHQNYPRLLQRAINKILEQQARYVLQERERELRFANRSASHSTTTGSFNSMGPTIFGLPQGPILPAQPLRIERDT